MRHAQPREGRRGITARFFTHPIIQMMLFLLVLAPVRIAIATFELRMLGIERPGSSFWYNIACVIVFVGAYIALVRMIEHRGASELSGVQAWPEAAGGVAIGALLFSIIIAIIAAAGAFTVTDIRLPDGLLAAITLWIFVAVSEEIGLRGVIFRLLESWSGSWIALAVSAVFFGAMHLGNKDVSWAGVTGIAIGSGVLYAAIFMITRRLWAVTGVHFAWNLTEGTIFGTPVSGFAVSSVLTSHLSGSSWLTGGAFGPEASVPALIVLVLAGVLALRVAHKRGQFIRPVWRRPHRSPQAANQEMHRWSEGQVSKPPAD